MKHWMVWAMYIFFYTGYIFDIYDIPYFGGNISCVKLFVDPVQKDIKELLFDDPNIDDLGERKSIHGEKCSYVYV